MTIRVVLISIVLTLGLSGLGLALCIHRYQFTERQLVESRLYFIVNELRSVIQTGLDDLELQLSELSNLQDRLREDVARDPLISAIVIFDERDRILFAANATDNPDPEFAPGMPILLEWRRSLAPEAGRSRQPRTPALPALGVRLTSDFGQPTGGIILQHHYRPAPWTALLSLDDPRIVWTLLGMLLALTMALLLVTRLSRRAVPPLSLATPDAHAPISR